MFITDHTREEIEPVQLRYGENPHQKAAFYVDPAATHPCVATAKVLHGKELSYNNILDLDTALRPRARVRRAGRRRHQAHESLRNGHGAENR